MRPTYHDHVLNVADLIDRPGTSRRVQFDVAVPEGFTLPLATIHDAVLEFLRGRDDAVLYGAQAVNELIEEFDLERLVHLPSGDLPGGYKQRLAMAVALVPDDAQARLERISLTKAVETGELSTAQVRVDVFAVPDSRPRLPELVTGLLGGASVDHESRPSRLRHSGSGSLD